MRRTLLVVPFVLAAACGKKNQEAPAGARFAPSDAQTVLRLDVAKARAWTSWPKVAPLAFRAIQPALDGVKQACGLDLLNEASSILLARRGVGAEGDLTLSIAGLPKDKVTGCEGKIGSAIPGVEIVADGDRFQVNRGGKGFASGAILPSGEVLIVSRGAAAIDAAAWKDEVSKGGGALPAWWSELDHVQPVAMYAQSKERTITASAELGDPFVLRLKLVAPSESAAQVELARAKAVVDFLQKADAGVGRLEPHEATIHADFTATGPQQIDRLLTAALSMLGGDPQAEAAAPPTATNTTPIECSALGGAVTTYMETTMSKMAPDQKQLIEPTIAKLIAGLQKAYVDACTQDKWEPAAIHCHVDNAVHISRFEKCRLVLPADQRTRFDALVKAALDGAR